MGKMIFGLLFFQVELFEKMGKLEGLFSYQLDENSELMTPEGPENSEIPMDSTAVFQCSVTGTY